MSLSFPLPDDPKKWEEWRQYPSENFYERLCLRFEDEPGPEQIEEHCRQLLIWWQKKLPLKNQPSNPLAQMLRAGLDDAPRFLTEARAALLNEESRQKIDAVLRLKIKENIRAEFNKFLAFSISDGVLTSEAEERLMKLGRERGLTEEEIGKFVDRELNLRNAIRKPSSGSNQGSQSGSGDPEQEFVRLLNLSGLEGEDMTDDQRDAFVNMAENLGLSGGDAEDIIDEWMESQTMQTEPMPLSRPQTARIPAARSTVVVQAPRPEQRLTPVIPELSPHEELREFQPFTNKLGMQMRFIPSGTFLMGSGDPAAQPIEQPVHKVTLSRYYMARFPVTNAQYEQYLPAHRARRLHPDWDDHPVVYVSSLDAIRFCDWLSGKEGVRYRLPTEAEWEYAARGPLGRIFPWGDKTAPLGNFADRNTKFAWSDLRMDDGFSQTSPVGSFPAGSSPFGLEDMAGNVWEWCSDFFESYSLRDQINPRGLSSGSKRVHRGGSWRSRFANLRATARAFNSPDYSYNDVGFRVVCVAG